MLNSSPYLVFLLLMFAVVFVLYRDAISDLMDTISRHEFSKAMVSKMRATPHIKRTTKTVYKLALAKDVALTTERTDYIEIFTEKEKEPSTVPAADDSNIK